MQKIDKLLISLNEWIEKADTDDFTDSLPDDLEVLDMLPGYVEDFEKEIAKLLRKQRKYFVDGIKNYTKKDALEKGIKIKDVINFVTGSLFGADTFAKSLSKAARKFLDYTMKDMTTAFMNAIDPDIQFNIFSKRTTNWINSWSDELGKIMKINSHKAVERILNDGLEKGKGIKEIARELAKLPEFDRKRARRTAVTETLAACSASQLESYRQSPAVTGKKWRHSGSKGITPRENHVEYDGTVVPVEEEFELPDSGERCMFPRDSSLSAKERVECHCVMSPAVDNDILGLSEEEKQKIREETLKELNKK
ncbi:MULTISPECIES: phage minor head protein [Bacillus cereus group]|uniref:phage minor head protein n=1 Tax=Bacillus cereus group TaxID=86661 RepID=UPI00202B14FE|nr:phage minor head protein [Bacillus thuringiensis]MCX3322675.1 phage minor head protein [Bacillus paranthracis]UQM92423.1 phage head morphogenesis protein [Bacillus thuringiensis]